MCAFWQHNIVGHERSITHTDLKINSNPVIIHQIKIKQSELSMPVFQTEIPGANLLNRGKVRDIYELGDTLLLVASDRVSAFDVVMDQPVPEKGRVLTEISKFWFAQTSRIIDNHFISDDMKKLPDAYKDHRDILKNRSMIVKKPNPSPWSAWYGPTLPAPGGRTTKKQERCAAFPFPRD